MNQKQRIETIEKAVDTGDIKTIRYKDRSEPFNVKEIPLDSLVYNPYNGRIRSLIKSFESSLNRSVNNEVEEDILVIEQYLYDSAKGKNEKTLESIREIGQQEIGIVTKDGVIIDGNRRAMLLNIIKSEDSSRNTFKAIVLPDNLKDNEKEITLLETRYQMGVDSKVDYNPIEKYIRCYELLNTHGLSMEEVSEIMAESLNKIKEWQEILELMEEYLEFVGSPKVYTRLDKREGHFVDLRGYMNGYKNRRHALNWNCSEDDLDDLKNVYFDYIRLGIPVHRARIIAKPTLSNSFFCKREIWNEFIEEHSIIKSSFIEDKFEEIKLNNSNYSNEDVIRELDRIWKENIEEKLINNLSFNEIQLKDIVETYNPLKLLKRVRNSLGQIRPEVVEKPTKAEVLSLIDDIKIRLQEINEIILNKNGED